MIKAFFLGGLAALVSLFGSVYLYFCWLSTPVEGRPVPLRALVLDRAASGNCEEALALSYLAVTERAREAIDIWQGVRSGSDCANWEDATRYDAAVEIVKSSTFTRIDRSPDPDLSPLREWMSIDVADAPPGGFGLSLRRDAFARRCYGALMAAGLPEELRLRRLIMIDFPSVDLSSDLPWHRIDGCVAAARRLAREARAQGAAEDMEPFAMWWERHAAWLEAWADMFTQFEAGGGL